MSTCQALLGPHAFLLRVEKAGPDGRGGRKKASGVAGKGAGTRNVNTERCPACLNVTRASLPNCHGNSSIEPEHL